MSVRILIVEDEPHIRLGLTEALRAEGWEPVEAPNGAEATGLLRSTAIDLILLDVMLPGKSGFDLCREWRAASIRIPILFLTAKGQEVDKVLGLELGADDYLAKPFSLRELTARIRALLRRSRMTGAGESATEIETIRFGEVTLDTKSLRGTAHGRAVELSPRELAVLHVLYREAGNAVTREQLLNEVWGVDYYGTTRTLDQVIVKLRQKLEKTAAKPEWIVTVHGHGYRLEVAP